MSPAGRSWDVRRFIWPVLFVMAVALLLMVWAALHHWWHPGAVEPILGAAIDRMVGQTHDSVGPSRTRDARKPAGVGPFDALQGSAAQAVAVSSGRSLRGRVVDALDGSAVAGAHARTFPDSSEALEEVADEQGWLELRSLLQGSAEALDVVGEHYFPARFDLSELRAQLDAGAAALLRVLPVASLRARVASEVGEPLAGVHLDIRLRDRGAWYDRLQAHLPRYAEPWNREHLQRVFEYWHAKGAPVPRLEDLEVIEALTDENGEYAFPPLPAGVPLIVRCSGIVQPAQTDVVLRAGPGETRVDLVGRVGARVQGRLLRGGTPLGQERIQIDSVQSRQSWHTYTSPYDGSFVVDGVTSGRAVLYVPQPGFELLELEVAPPVVDLGDLVLPSLVRCTGRLISMHPFRGAVPFTVSFISEGIPGRRPWVAANVGAGGDFSARVPAGRQELLIGVAGAPGGVGYFAKLTFVAPFSEVEVAVDPFLGSIGFSLRGPEGPLQGEVEASLRMNEEGSELDVRRVGVGRRGSTVLELGDGGRGFWHHVVPGRYDLALAGAQGGAHFVSGVEVRAGGITDLGWIEVEVAKLAGTVTGADGIAMSEVEVCAIDVAGKKVCAALGEEGAYRLEMLAPGPSRVELLDRRSMPLVVRDVVLLPGENTLDMALPLAARLEGRVLSGGELLTGAVVQLFPGGRSRAGLTPLLRSESDGSGRFELGPLPPGHFLLSVDRSSEPRGGARIDLELAEAESREVEVQLAEERTHVRFVLKGEALLDVEEVWCFIGFLPGPMEVATVAPDAEGWASVPASPGPAHFLLRRASRDLDVTAWISVPRTYLLAAEARAGLRPGQRQEIALEGVAIELRHPADLPSTLLPTLDIEGFARFDLLRHLPAYSLARLERRAGSVLYAPVPPGARLVLSGFDGHGRLRELRFSPTADVVLEWP